MKKTIIVKIDNTLHGRKIEYILEKHIGLSTTLVRRLKRTGGGIVLNGKNVTVIDRVCAGDKLVITIPGRQSKNIVPVDIPVDILYEDEDIIAVNKPRSMPTHPSCGHQSDTLANGVIHHLGRGTAFHAITRLDRDTSGVVLIAKNSAAAALLTEDMKNKRIRKEYVAVVNGVPVPECGIISAPVKKKENSGILRHIAADGKEAITQYEVKNTLDELTFVKLLPITGRTHQLRVHMSYIGTPIYGDRMYGAPQSGEQTRLHCHRISFFHPMTKEEITVTAPIPEDITDLMKKL